MNDNGDRVRHLSQLNSHFAEFSYAAGYVKTDRDAELFEELSKFADAVASSGHVHLKRWFRHMATFPRDEAPKLKMTWQEGGDISLPEYLLTHIENNGTFESIDFAETQQIDHQKVIGAIKSLLTHDGLISTDDYVVTRISLTNEGSAITQNGSHEYQVYAAIPADGLERDELMKKDFAKVGFGKAKQNGWIDIKGKVIVRKAADVKDTVREDLLAIKEGRYEDVDPARTKDLKKRKLISEATIKGVKVGKGPAFKTELEKPEVELTADMLQDKSWATKTFKAYNFNAMGQSLSGGHLHPLMKVRSEFREIFLQMGFSEMDTSRYVESSFWNFDALFQPQQHPARDAHDTFFIKVPEFSQEFPPEYLEKVKKVHSEGGYGSIGYRYDWSIEEAKKNVMRTHTTAVSARMLYKLANEGFKPSKFFSIDRVFRNETLDATHLAEFHQIEGVIAERNLSLAHVMGLFKSFFSKMGLDDLRFKSAYNPYTEPSMEIFAYHKGLDKSIEIGNSGMFRPEMLLPMGLPEDVNVVGFGLSLERPTMIKYGIDNIRELFGPKVDLDMVYKNPMCRLDKD
uniref:phenylalanine--tRNA ligase n=1 Tax=Steinernema glaseri TaxID=37863 RepID=A0A1I8ASY8_9BILA